MEKDITQNESSIKKVVICGPESTGKSTLTQELASYFNTNYVSEYARDYLQSKWDDKKEVCDKLTKKFKLKASTVYYETGVFSEETSWDVLVPNDLITDVKRVLKETT